MLYSMRNKPGRIKRFNRFRMLHSPINVMNKSPTARPPVPTRVANNPLLNVPTANDEGTTLLMRDATKDSQDSIPEKAIKLPII